MFGFVSKYSKFSFTCPTLPQADKTSGAFGVVDMHGSGLRPTVEIREKGQQETSLLRETQVQHVVAGRQAGRQTQRVS